MVILAMFLVILAIQVMLMVIVRMLASDLKLSNHTEELGMTCFQLKILLLTYGTGLHKCHLSRNQESPNSDILDPELVMLEFRYWFDLDSK